MILILVKHSLPEIRSELPAAEWQLSEEGRRRCSLLAKALESFDPDGLLASDEPKAAETARLAAQKLGLSVRLYPNLHEHARQQAGYSSHEVFAENVRSFFNLPDRLVFGEETADRTHQRFSSALKNALEQSGLHRPVVVAHGTVISLFVSRLTGMEPFPLWQRLGLPSIVAVDLEKKRAVQIIEEINQ